jgi:hypothetical protein
VNLIFTNGAQAEADPAIAVMVIIFIKSGKPQKPPLSVPARAKDRPLLNVKRCECWDIMQLMIAGTVI